MNRFSKLCALCAALAMSTTSFAQSSLLATLSHEGNITSYYGTNALKEAVNAAVNGDVVTLSSGQFNAVNIDKAITVRGAGMAADSVSGSQPTVLTGDFLLSAPSDSTDAKLILEGLYHNHEVTYSSNIKNAQIIKCRFKEFEYKSGTKNVSMSFIQCRVNSRLYLAENSSFTCINSYIYYPGCASTTTSNFEMQNCMIYYHNNARNDSPYCHLCSSMLSNCIIVPYSNTYLDSALPSSSMAYNCISVGSRSSSFFNYMPNGTNKCESGYGMFKTFTGTWNDDAEFGLTDEAAAKYLGTDGTQVGIYGGMMPYEITPNNPQITKFNVASKSTADGKLSVDIQVGVAE